MYFNNLKKLRMENDLTQKEIARKLNCKRSSYTNWEYGIVMIPLDIADKLSLFYNVKLSYILGLDKSAKLNFKIKKLDYNILLKNLYRLKIQNKNTFEKISNYLRCNKSTCSRYFNGYIMIPIDRLILLSELYNIDLDVLCGKVNETNQNILL